MLLDSTGPVEVELLGKTRRVDVGTLLSTILPAHRDQEGRPYLGAIINNRTVSLDAPIWTASKVQLLTVAHPEGALIYRRCATYVMYAAFRDLYPRRKLEIGQSVGSGYHFQIDDDHTPDLAALSARMSEIIAQDRPIVRRAISVEAAIGLFEERGELDRVRLLHVWPESFVHLASLGEHVDIQYGPVASSTGSIGEFELLPLEPGFSLHFPTRQSPVWRPDSWGAGSRIFDTYRETRRWNSILGVHMVGELNQHCMHGGAGEVIKVAEGLHEKQIARIADQVTERQPAVRLVTIAGPSSSGKTTFAKRLSIQLRVNGIRPVALSLDDYYVDRIHTPLHADGSYDFETVDALDIELINEHLARLLAGEPVRTPRFDFVQGKRMDEPKWRTLQLEPDQVLLIEGIHGLNDRLTASVPADSKFRIYISALTQLILDRANRIGTSDTRLIRRIVRDRRYRGFNAADTIRMWPSVREGERKHIFPFQDLCDVMFNSALVYEAAALKVLADRYLLEVSRDDPAAVKAHHLRKFLQLFVPIFPDDVPRSSIIREFIGGSAFRY